MKRTAVLTSGGDAPGMNAAIRAVVRTAAAEGWSVLGIRNGFTGLVAGTVVPLGPRDVSNVIQLGGTMLGSRRCPEFSEEACRCTAIRDAYGRGKSHAIIVVAEGARWDGKRLVAFDRLLATHLGAAAVQRLAQGERGCLVGWLHGEVATTPLPEVVAKRKTLDARFVERARVLAR